MLENIIWHAEFGRNRIIYAASTDLKETFSRWRIRKHNFKNYSLKYNCRSYLYTKKKKNVEGKKVEYAYKKKKKKEILQ